MEPVMCSQCGAEMSQTDQVCPKCGKTPEPLPNYPRFSGGAIFMVMWVFFVVLIVVMLVSMFSMN